MNASGTIAAAIEKLEAQRDAAVPGPWAFSEDDGGLYIEAPEREQWNMKWPTLVLRFEREWDTEDAAAELIVTLHRTIDAQLTLLRASLRYPAMTGHGLATLDLARAILGETKA